MNRAGDPPEWDHLVARVLGIPPERVTRSRDHTSFVALGGTSLLAAELAATAARDYGLALDMTALLGEEPIAGPLRLATPCQPLRLSPGQPGHRRPASPTQSGILAHEAVIGGTAYHLLFSVHIDGRLSMTTMSVAVRELAARHSSLRTSLEPGDEGGWTRVVHDGWAPPLHVAAVHLPDRDPAGAAQVSLAASSATLIGAAGVPPVCFFLTSDPVRPSHVLSLVAHHALLDGWSVGLLWRDLADLLTRPPVGTPVDAGQDAIVERWAALQSAGLIEARAAEYARRLAGAPTIAELPADRARPAAFDPAATRLAGGMSPEAVRACDDLARAHGITRNAVLLAAWALVLTRQCGVTDLLVGVAVAGRSDDTIRQVVGMRSGIVPVRFRTEPGLAVWQYLRQAATGLAEAIRFCDVPFARLVRAMGVGGSVSHHPVVQFGFGAHDELIPDQLDAGELTLRPREGHCGGCFLDAMLYVQRWGRDCRLALDYAKTALRPEEAAGLMESLEAALLGLSAQRDRLLGEVSGVSERQERLVRGWGTGAEVPDDATLWTMIQRTAARRPDAVALSAGRIEVSYRDLITRAESLAARLRAVHVGPGDHVLIDMPRGVAEIIAVLAAVRLGAVYVGVDSRAPAAQSREVAARLSPRALLIDGSRRSVMRPHVGAGCAVVDAGQATAAGRPGGYHLPEPASDPGHPVYVSFTSGSTGRPKGVRVAQRGVTRLIASNADYVRRGPGERFLRLSPLAFDASTLEIFAPLTGGGRIEIFAADPVTPDAVASFIVERQVTVLWLTAGLFRLMADHHADAFAGVRQVLTGGDVVPVEQVRALARRHTGLRITNGYGPTESTTFAAVYHVDSPADITEPLPIGRPIPGTGLLVLDDAGALVPPGALGELWIDGPGLAIDYLGDEAATAAAFLDLAAQPGRRRYRTGDLVRWDGQGRLRFAGRTDRQVKVSGHRVEPVAIERVLREHPAVMDAVIVVDRAGGVGSRLVAGVAADPGAVSEGELRQFAGQRLPGYAVPSLWALIERIPVTGNGKVDAAALRELAAGARPAPVPASVSAPVSASVWRGQAAIVLDELVTRIWAEVLGHNDFGLDDPFFAVGGDSIQLAEVHRRLSRHTGPAPLTLIDLYRLPTVRALADCLQTRGGAPPAPPADAS